MSSPLVEHLVRYGYSAFRPDGSGLMDIRPGETGQFDPTKPDEWAVHGCCKDGLTDEEADRIHEVMSAAKASESIFETSLSPTAIHEALVSFKDFRHHDAFADFLAGCNS